MNKSTSQYFIYEGSFYTESPVIDRTVNILMFRDPSEKEYSIIISRASLDEEQELDNWCEKQLETMKNQLPGFTPEGKMLKNEIGPARLPVIQVANSHLNDGETVHQVQSIVHLPRHSTANPDKRGLIIFTLRSATEFTEYQRKHYVQVINSYDPEACTPS